MTVFEAKESRVQPTSNAYLAYTPKPVVSKLSDTTARRTSRTSKDDYGASLRTFDSRYCNRVVQRLVSEGDVDATCRERLLVKIDMLICVGHTVSSTA